MIFARCRHKDRQHKALGLCGGCYSVQWIKDNPSKAREQEQRRQRDYPSTVFSYGLNVAEYRKLVRRANNKCAVCRISPSKKRLSIDHDHKTGRVRGLLCNDCNLSIGRMKDSPKRLRRAANYLEGK